MWEDCGVVSDCEELVGVTWRLSDCEELSGGYSQGMMDLVLGYYSLYVTLLKSSDVPEVLEVQEVPFLTYWYVSGRIINLSN